MSSSAVGNSVLEQVVPHHLCCGCGTCVSACPTRALQMRETAAGYVWAAATAEAPCTHCGRCLKVCPGLALHTDLPAGDDPFLGTIRGCYHGWATATSVCERGSSGGVVTAILDALLTTGEIEAALVTRWDPHNPLRPQACWVRTPQELYAAQKSKYCMVPLGEQWLTSGLTGVSPEARLAVVGLPCHLHGLTNALAARRGPNIALKIGLFCDRTLSLQVIDRLLAAAKQEPAAVSHFEYRHKGRRGWPGDVWVQGANGKSYFVDRTVRMNLKEVFTPVRCRLCFDKFNVQADLSCGDGYGAPHRAAGVSTLLVRTAAGEAALTAAQSQLHLTPIDRGEFARVHGLAERKCRVAVYTAAYQALKPEASLPLPASCQKVLAPVGPREVARCQRELSLAMHLENAPDRAAAEQCLHERFKADRGQRIGRELRNLLGRVKRAVKDKLMRSAPSLEDC